MLAFVFAPFCPPCRSGSSDYFAAISYRRVVIVDYYGVTLMDNFVKPTLPVSNYRTNVTGIEQQHLESGEHEILIFPIAHSQPSP